MSDPDRPSKHSTTLWLEGAKDPVSAALREWVVMCALNGGAKPSDRPDKQAVSLAPLAFDAIEGWQEDELAAAFRAYLKSCRKLPRHDAAYAAAIALGDDADGETARAFFERYFVPHAVEGGTPGFVTGYYEPEVRGARAPHGRFTVPVYGLPDDLVVLAADTARAQYNHWITAMRDTEDGAVPYYTRAEIWAGALQGRALELLYLDDPVELFYMQVQGSGLVHLDDGSNVRLTYAGKNGHPYTSIGRVLIERGDMTPDDIDMDKVKAWLRADPERGRTLMQENKSYVFFRALDAEEGRDGPLGARGVPLTPGRSLAVDSEYIPLGTPVFVTAPALETPDGRPFRRLMAGQDVGSAIRGPERGDIFWGTGEGAGAIAGKTRHAAKFHVFLPKG
jgi:membrane-bound lytic murein transglycosylase A